jgi:hypothetical protein
MRTPNIGANIMVHKVAHEIIAQVHIPLYFFGVLKGVNNETSTIHQLLKKSFIFMPF